MTKANKRRTRPKKGARRKCAHLRKCWTNHFNIFNVLADHSIPSTQKKAIIMNMSDDQISSFGKILNDFCFNRSGNILTKSEAQKLHRDRAFIKTIASRKTPNSVKKQAMAQKGGFLPFLMPLLATGAGLIGKALLGSVVKSVGKGLIKGVRQRRR